MALPFSGVVTNAADSCYYYTIGVDFLTMGEDVVENAAEINVDSHYFCHDAVGHLRAAGTAFCWGSYGEVVDRGVEFFDDIDRMRLPDAVKRAATECIVENARLLVEQEASIGQRLAMALEINVILGGREMSSEYEYYCRNGVSVDVIARMASAGSNFKGSSVLMGFPCNARPASEAGKIQRLEANGDQA